MLGNFSFGGYFKEEAITLAHTFITKELKLTIDYVTVFEGNETVAADTESEKIWKSIDKKITVKKFGKEDNFWGPTGEEGPCGPTTEIYVNGIEIWNIVFNEFYQEKDKTLRPLEVKGVDTGMGLERLAMVVQKKKNVFGTDLFEDLLKLVPKEFDEKKKRIIADHCRAIAFLISDGVLPSNKNQGYILRRLMRRVMIYSGFSFAEIFSSLANQYQELQLEKINEVFRTELDSFTISLQEGLRLLQKMEHPETKDAFLLYQTYGLPIEVIQDKIPNFNQKEFDEAVKKHQELSRTASAGMFKGGLADHSPETVKLHTAHHLLLAALQELFGRQVKQRGSNITAERLRIDFSFDRKLTDEEKKKLEDMVNEKITEGLDVVKREMPKEEAEKIGAEMEFGVKYGNTVSVYFIEDKKGNMISKEFCGGPHVANTSELGKFKIIKEEAVSAGVRRIKAILE